MKKEIKIGIILFVWITILGMITFAGTEKIKVKYLKTSDGDTMRAMLDGENVRIRFLGINTPEVSGENKEEEPWGNEALAYTKSRLDEAQKIEIEYDDVADHEDRFGRKLAWIWVDDELFEVELLEKGFAKTYMLQNDYRYAKELKAAEQKAKKEKVGVWSDQTSRSSTKETQIEESPKMQEQKQNQEAEFIPTFGDSGEEESFSMSTILIALGIILIIIWLTKKGSRKQK